MLEFSYTGDGLTESMKGTRDMSGYYHKEEKMSEIRDKVKQEIKLRIRQRSATDDWMLEGIVNSILSIPEIAVVDREAELPENPFPKPRLNNPSSANLARYYSYQRAQQDMLENSWVKEIKDVK